MWSVQGLYAESLIVQACVYLLIPYIAPRRSTATHQTPAIIFGAAQLLRFTDDTARSRTLTYTRTGNHSQTVPKHTQYYKRHIQVSV